MTQSQFERARLINKLSRQKGMDHAAKVVAEPWTTDQLSRGLGDTIAKATRAVGIKPCGGCKKRQAALNKLLPYRRGQ